MREWVSLLLLHYCVYNPDTDTRSLQWNRPPHEEVTISTQASSSSSSSSSMSKSSSMSGKTSKASTKAIKEFIQQFTSEHPTNPCLQLINRTVNDRFLADIYPSAFTAFRLPLNPLLLEIVKTAPGTYRCVYAGEDAQLLADMNQNPTSALVSGTSPQSPIAGQFPWSNCTPLYIDHLRSSFNRSQLFAMEAALYLTQSQTPSGRPVSRFTLIQGPPGTGKTRTLLSLLNVLQNQQFSLYYEQLRSYINNMLCANRTTFLISLDSLNKARIQMKETLERPRILVCTPSNAAVNTIIDGIMRNGFIDNSGKRYNPSILRLGSGTSRDHWSVSLEYIVEVGNMID